MPTSVSTEKLHDIADRVERIDRRVGALERDNAVASERHHSLTKRLDRIDMHVARLVWVVFAAIIGAGITFVAGGGFVIK